MSPIGWMDDNRKKYLGRELIQGLTHFQLKSERETRMREFLASPSDIRHSVTEGVLAIGLDRSQRIVDRIRALSVLVWIIKECGLTGEIHMYEALENVVDCPTFSRGGSNQGDDAMGEESGNLKWLLHTALLGLILLDRVSGLQKLDSLIVRYADSGFGTELRELRMRFS